MHYIETRNLCKEIKGNLVLKNIDLNLKGDKIYGIVGKNGSGKTMLFRVLSGLVKPSSGKVLLDGNEIHVEKHNVAKIGLVIENASLYPAFTGLKNLMLLAKINNYIGEEEVRDAIKRVGLNPDDKRVVRKYSLGMKQRIAIAQAIMEKPDFLFLDEPTNALDTEGVEIVRNIIREEAKRGALVFLASHNVEDIDILCDDTFKMAEGSLYQEAGK
ncbi:MAG: Daunorubicin/doxorubicin resistance ATP-binding protein DrrA [Firmicutes bacterium ADurb.Bin419]|nr:MAG: Daunorubicin/doxorubicin resistance ATP-binding protein DrrA [Firmicutes bacterium ADurb.Bin419]